jgi:altronate hydrolase
MQRRAVSPALGDAIVATVAKAARYYTIMGHGSFSPGNADGGLTTQEEKSLGAYAKSGSSPIVGILKPGDQPAGGGLYLLDVVPDGEPRFGFPNVSDNAEIVELISCGAHITLFTTGRGSVVGSAISPVIKVCANPQTFLRMADDMDINAGKILTGEATLEQVGAEIVDAIVNVAGGAPSRSEDLGHQEFVLTYKQFSAVGPGCFPLRAG